MRSRRSTATIAIYCLFTLLLWMTLWTNASEDLDTKNTTLFTEAGSFNQNHKNERRVKVFEKKWKIFSRLLIAKHKLKQIKKSDQDIMRSPFQKCNPQVLSTIFNEFLTICDILTLRTTCTDFQILLRPNDDKNMVMFCKEFGSEEMDHIPLMWFDLRYLLQRSYTNAFKKIELLNLKQNQHYVVLPSDEPEQLSFYNNDEASNLFPEMIHNKLPIDYVAPKIYVKSGRNTWAEITNEGNVITGGREEDGGDSSIVQSQLKNVKTIVSTLYAFTALSNDGSVVSWGDKDYGGQIPESIQTQLHKNVKSITSNDSAFAALLENENVVTWGYKHHGGNIPELIQIQLKNVKTIIHTKYAFAALTRDGRVVSWGNEKERSEISDDMYGQLDKNVKMIISNDNAFAALCSDGRVVAWGFGTKHCGQIEESIKPKLKNIKMLFSTNTSFSALLDDGCVLEWEAGGRISHEYNDVNMVFSNDGAFFARKNDGRFLGWGLQNSGGIRSYEIETQLKNLKVIYSSSHAFAALLKDGSVFTWGSASDGGRIPDELQPKLTKNVKMIIPDKNGFIALCNDGEIVMWGNF